MPPSPRPPFPDGSFTRLWDAILRQARSSPHLAPVKTFQSWLGGPMGEWPVSYDMLPALRFTPAAGTFRWADECRFDGDFVVRVRIAVKGADASHLFNFWQALAKALSPTNEFLLELHAASQAYNVTMAVPAFEPTLICDGQAIQADGAISFRTNVNI